MDHEAEVGRLRALLAERDASLAAAAAEIESLRARLEAAEEVSKRLERELDQLRRQIIGPSSERVVDPDALPVAVAPEDAAEASVPAPEGATEQEKRDEKAKDRERPRKPHRDKRGRRKVEEMDHLRTIVHEESVQVRWCPCGCGAPAKTIGHDVSWRIERIPAEYVRHKILREKVAFPGHVGAQDATVVTAAPPIPYALPKALCGNNLLAQVIVDKYVDHLPLHRQAERFQREGFDLSRSTLCDWAMDLAKILTPICTWMALGVRGGSWLRADATGMPVLDSSRTKGKTHHGHLWAWGNYETVVFGYTPDKTAPTVLAMFAGFAGVILIDGASDFNLVEAAEGVTRAGCWSHARRMLYKAMSYDKGLALAGLTAIRQLFVAERGVMGAPVADRVAMRRELCQPVLVGLRRWVDIHLPNQIPGTPMHQALQYLDNQWPRLEVFLTTAEIACHNNDTERDLRRPVKGKTNYLFAGSPRGAEAMGVFYTLFGTCLLQAMDPRRYLEDILGRLDEPPSHLTPQAVRARWESPRSR
jgi:transposase